MSLQHFFILMILGHHHKKGIFYTVTLVQNHFKETLEIKITNVINNIYKLTQHENILFFKLINRTTNFRE